MKKHLERIYADGKDAYFALLQDRLANNVKTFTVTANPEIFVYGKNDGDITRLLSDSQTSLVPDSIAVVMACKKYKHPVKERIPGVDICAFLLEEADRQGKSVFLFGARPHVNQKLVEAAKAKYPNLVIAGAEHGYTDDKEAVFDQIAGLKPDICLVALGVPEQEKLIYNNLHKFSKGIFVGVGGSFDVISGEKNRAPAFFINHNLEWLYRIAKEPRRLRRFISCNIRFLLPLF